MHGEEEWAMCGTVCTRRKSGLCVGRYARGGRIIGYVSDGMYNVEEWAICGTVYKIRKSGLCVGRYARGGRVGYVWDGMH